MGGAPATPLQGSATARVDTWETCARKVSRCVMSHDVRLSICPSVCLSVHLPVCLSVCPSAHLSVCPSACLPICLSVCLSVCLSAECPAPSWGYQCKQVCLCENGGTCHHASGVCACPSGWEGPTCNDSKCVHVCSCVSVYPYVCMSVCTCVCVSIRMLYAWH